MIGIIAAMDQEVKELINLMTDVKHKIISGLNFYQGKIENKDVVLLESGIGKIKATFSTTILINNFDIDYIINIGSCGSFKKDIKIKDIVVAKKIAFYDLNIPGWDKHFDNPKITVDCDLSLINHAFKIIKNNIHIGNMVCGDSFICKQSQVEEIINNFKDLLACDMESGAIAYVAKTLKIPCLIIRGVSDNVLNDDNDLAFDKYIIDASKSSANFCKEFILSY